MAHEISVKEILDYYKLTNSIRGTASDLNISEGVVRKVLITAGLWTSNRVEQIAELRSQGLDDKQIAEKLNVSVSCVNANSPYTKGSYMEPSETINAQRIRVCRNKKSLFSG